MHIKVGYQLSGTFCTSAAQAANPAAPFANVATLPRVLPVIRKHSISVGRVSRPSAECAEKVLSSSSFATLVLHSSTVPAAAAGRRVGWLELLCLGGRGAEKVKRCETAASSGSRPRGAWELERRGAETFTFIIGTTGTGTRILRRQSNPRAKCLWQGRAGSQPSSSHYCQVS